MFNTDLIDDLARERVVVFLGAGVSASATTQSGKKILDWEAFLQSCRASVSVEISDIVGELLNRKDFLLACELLQGSLQEQWISKINEEFGQKATPSSLHEAIISLKQRIFLTTNFDKLLESAFDATESNESHYPVVMSRVNDDTFRSLKDHNRRYIIKIHGTVDDPNNMVFSRSEYIRLAFGNGNYSVFLENLLLNYTFLFVGFSMDDPAIISLMEMYALRYPSARPHYLFAAAPIDPALVEINKRLRKLLYIQYDAKNNHAALPGHISDLAGQAASRRREVLAIAL